MLQAILLATGEDARLRPLTETLPSPMLPVANRPAITYPLELLARTGLREARVSLYYLGASIEVYLGDGARWGLHLDYRLQREPWGSAGAIKWAAGQSTETLLVLPGDALVDVDLDAVIAFHRTHGGPLTVVLAPPTSLASATLSIDPGDGQVTPGGADALAYTGVCVLEPALLAGVPAYTPFGLSTDLIPALLAKDVPVHGYRLRGYWNPLDSFDAYQDAQRVYLHSTYTSEEPRLRFPYIEGRQVAPGIWVGHNPAIHPSARLAPPICLGHNCRVGRDVELGPMAVVGNDVIVDDEATVQRCTILADTYLGRLVNVQDRVIHKTLMIDAASGESVRVIDRHLLGETAPEVVSGRLRGTTNALAAALLMLLSLPLSIIVGLLTLLTTGGRLFRRDWRVGRPITSPEEDPPLHGFALLGFATRRADGTATRFGQWLERTECDHLPTLWNVVRGDLLLVGVKPLRPEDAAEVQEEWARQRYQWPAGLTGLWYVQPQVGPHPALGNVLIADAYYKATRSWRQDLRILAQTPRAWGRRMRSLAGRHKTDVGDPEG